MDNFSKSCRKCGERMSIDAHTCGACGAAADPKKRVHENAVQWDHVCTWRFGGLCCTYPVGMFAQGMHGGFCIAHRQTPAGTQAARIAEESQGHTREQYIELAKRIVYGAGGDNAANAKLRARLRKVESGEKVGIITSRLYPDREPGADEQESAA